MGDRATAAMAEVEGPAVGGPSPDLRSVRELRLSPAMVTADRRPPGPGRLGVTTAVRFRRDPLALIRRLAREFGDVVSFRAGPFTVFLLSHPDAIQEVLVTHNHRFMKGQALQEARRLLGQGLLTSEGDLHRRQRRMIQPLFHRRRIAAYAEVMTDYAARAAGRWPDGGTIDLHQEMVRLTLAIVGKTLFDTDIEAREAREVGRALTTIMGMFDRLTLPFAGLLERLSLLRGTRRFLEAKERLDRIIYRMIEDRRTAGASGADLLSLLLAAQDQEGDGAGMPAQQVRDEAMTIFLAGHETTANALTWTFYLLSQNPEAERRLHAEVDDVLGDRLATAEDVPHLRYTEMVLAESMRLFPPAWIVGRRALAEHEVGGYRLPPGSLVGMSQFLVHHDPRWFPEPDRFAPERWRPEEEAGRPKFSYFPFGGGPRLCIGEPFAWMEGVLVTATIAQRWRMRLAAGQAVEPLPLVTLRPKHGMRMRLERRRP